MPVIDAFSDPAFATLFWQVKDRPELESFVKNAEVTFDERERLPDTAFAWPAERKFPIHTPEHAALSYVYAKVAAALPEEVQSAISTALEVYGVPLEMFETGEKVAAEVEYLVPELKLFPANSPAEVKYAQARLLEEFDKLDLENRTLASVNLVKQAQLYGVTVEPELLKSAGLVVSDLQKARVWIDARTAKLPVTQSLFKVAYEALANGLHGKESKDRDGLMKVASALADLDAQSGMDKYYDRRLPDAVRTIFNTEKIASATVDVNGAMIPVSKIAALPASFWEDLGGRELSDEIAPGGNVDVSKVATIVDTLPLDLKVILRKQLRA